MADLRQYYDIADIDDALLKDYVIKDKNIMTETSNYVESFALSLGVEAQYIAVPTPYRVKRFAELFAYMTVAQKNSKFSLGKEASNDSFALKYNMYKQLLDDAEKSLTAITFTNGVQAKKRRFPLSVRMERN